MMQAVAIFMLEASCKAVHMPNSGPQLLVYTKKIIRWLRSLGDDDLAAERAWKMTVKLVIAFADNINVDV
jgi:hypothetical protein